MYHDAPFFIFPGLGILSFLLTLLFLILPVILVVKFFMVASDIKKIKTQKAETDAAILARLRNMEKTLEELRRQAGAGNMRPAAATTEKAAVQDEGWAEGVTEAEKSEASVLKPRLDGMQGVIIKRTDGGGYDIWSRYSWERFGMMDSGYRLIYKNYKE